MPSDEPAMRSDGGPARPILGTPDEFPRRRGGRWRFLGYLLIGLIVAVMAVGWGYVLLEARGNPEVSAEVISFDASAANAAEITFSVHKPAERAAMCRLRAVDTRHMEVGSRMIDVPRGRSDLALTERLRTSAQATAVHVDYCDLV